MAGLIKRGETWQARVRWYEKGIRKEKQISLKTSKKVNARERLSAIQKVEADIKSGMNFFFPWQTNERPTDGPTTNRPTNDRPTTNRRPTNNASGERQATDRPTGKQNNNNRLLTSFRHTSDLRPTGDRPVNDRRLFADREAIGSRPTSRRPRFTCRRRPRQRRRRGQPCTRRRSRRTGPPRPLPVRMSWTKRST